MNGSPLPFSPAASITIDPEFPLCWEDEQTLRVGFERALVRVRAASPAEQRFVRALARGVPSGALVGAARRAGVSAARRDELLRALAPVLRSEDAGRETRPSAGRAAPLRVRVEHDGAAAASLEASLAAAGCVVQGGAVRPGAPPPGLVVLVEHYASPLHIAQRWLAAGVPQLLVRYSDGEIVIGPVLAVRGGPCRTCLALAAIDQDPALPRLAAQLAGTRPPGDSPATAALVAAYTADAAMRWRDGDAAMQRTRLHLPVRGGAISGLPRSTTVGPHPRCACGGLKAAA